MHQKLTHRWGKISRIWLISITVGNAGNPAKANPESTSIRKRNSETKVRESFTQKTHYSSQLESFCLPPLRHSGNSWGWSFGDSLMKQNWIWEQRRRVEKMNGKWEERWENWREPWPTSSKQNGAEVVATYDPNEVGERKKLCDLLFCFKNFFFKTSFQKNINIFLTTIFKHTIYVIFY